MRGRPLEIRLLGLLEVRRDGRKLALPRSRKARALLAYLVATRRAHGRSHLCDLLWDGPADPRAALRGALSSLRPLLDDDRTVRLVADGDRVVFEPGGALIDLDAVRAIAPDPNGAGVEALERATACFRGAFLEGLDLPRCYRFDTWCTAEREATRRLRIAILHALVERLRDRPEEALRPARDLLLLDPCLETAHLEVIRLLSRLGRIREALDQYDACRGILKRELGARPSRELEEVRRALLPTTAPVPLSPPSPPAPSIRPPLIGRRRERRVLARLLDTAGRNATRPLLLLVGEPGIGKTRLLEELGIAAREAGGGVLAGRAFEAETTRPYGAWIDALRAIPSAGIPPTVRFELASLLPELAPVAPGAAHELLRPVMDGERSRLFEAVARLLAHRAAVAPLVLLFDDLHWIDEASAALLHFVVRSVAASGVLLACASRRAELEDNPAASRLVRTLRREDALLQLSLEPLDADDTALLVRGVDPRLDADRIYAESEGNPLFALELSRTRRQGGGALPGTIGELIGERLTRLGPKARGLVPWAAALGRDFDLGTLARASELPTTELLLAVEELERRGILQAAGNGYDFTHDLVREVAYRRISDPRRRLIHGHIARILKDVDDPDHERAGEVARHAALGGDRELAARACLDAARRALWVYAPEEAAALAAQGIQHLEGLRPETRLALHLELLALSVYPGIKEHRLSDLEGELARVIREAREEGLHAQVQRGFQLIADIHYLRGDFGGALDRSLRAQEAGRAADPATVVRAIGDTARCLGIIERDLPRAEKLAREAEALAAEIGYEGHELPQALGYVHHHRGELDEALASFERAARRARSEQERWFECDCLARLTMIELERARSAAALERSRELIEVAGKLDEGSDAPFAEALQALSRLRSGGEHRMEEPTSPPPDDRMPADVRLERALEGLREADSRWRIAYVQNVAGEIDFDAGRTEAARERAEEALAAAEVVSRINEVAVARALLARLALAADDRDGAASQLAVVRGDLARPGALSARARGAVERAARALERPR